MFARLSYLIAPPRMIHVPSDPSLERPRCAHARPGPNAERALAGSTASSTAWCAGARACPPYRARRPRRRLPRATARLSTSERTPRRPPLRPRRPIRTSDDSLAAALHHAVVFTYVLCPRMSVARPFCSCARGMSNLLLPPFLYLEWTARARSRSHIAQGMWCRTRRGHRCCRPRAPDDCPVAQRPISLVQRPRTIRHRVHAKSAQCSAVSPQALPASACGCMALRGGEMTSRVVRRPSVTWGPTPDTTTASSSMPSSTRLREQLEAVQAGPPTRPRAPAREQTASQGD